MNLEKKIKIYSTFQILTIISSLFFFLAFVPPFLIDKTRKQLIPNDETNIFEMIINYFKFYKEIVINSVFLIIALIFYFCSIFIGLSISKSKSKNLNDFLFMIFVFVPFLSNLFCYIAILNRKVLFSEQQINFEKVKEESLKKIKFEKQQKIKYLKNKLDELSKKI